jgi:glyoxylase-like metal-dependent hydrolase (beta-lactamase superfamily II)
LRRRSSAPRPSNPSSSASRRASLSLVACPTSSIGGATAAEARTAARSFPEAVTAGVLYCGYASDQSYGASSYLIRRADGNVLVDSPRAAQPLLDNIAALGGVSRMFLTHCDDVADHAAFRRRFDCTRILHERDVRSGTRDIEYPLRGDEPIALAPDLLAIPVPGHTRGSTALLYRDEILFTGDHLWYSAIQGGLHASRSVCWFSWPEQTRSLRRLLDFRFEWILPGHGRRHHAPAAVMRAELERLLNRLRDVA